LRSSRPATHSPPARALPRGDRGGLRRRAPVNAAGRLPRSSRSTTTGRRMVWLPPVSVWAPG